MSTGPGVRQRALLAALNAQPSGVVRVVPDGVSQAEAAVWRRAAKRLAETGRARAIYVSVMSKDHRRMPHLALTGLDSTVQGDAYPLGAPQWVAPPPPSLATFSTRVQAALLQTSQATAYRLALKMVDSSSIQRGGVDRNRHR